MLKIKNISLNIFKFKQLIPTYLSPKQLGGLCLFFYIAFTGVTVNAQENRDPATPQTYYYDDFEYTGGSLLNWSFNNASTTRSFDLKTTAPINGSYNLSSTLTTAVPPTYYIGNKLINSATTISSTSNGKPVIWEWSILYKNTGGSNTDVTGNTIGLASALNTSFNAWKFWLSSSTNNPASITNEGYYITQKGNQIALVGKSNSEGYKTIVTGGTNIASGNYYNIKVQRVVDGTQVKWRMYITVNNTDGSSIDGGTNGDFNTPITTYNQSFLESMTRSFATNSFKFDDIKMYQRAFAIVDNNGANSGVATSAQLYQGQPNVVLFGFALENRGVTNVTNITIQLSQSGNARFSNTRLIQSDDASYNTTADNTPVATGFAMDGTASISVNLTLGTAGDKNDALPVAKYYFLVADVANNTNTPYPQIKFSFPGSASTSDYNFGTLDNSSSVSSNFTYIFGPGKILDWNGTTSTAWNTATNWTPNQVPTSADLARIGVAITFQKQPTLSGTAGQASALQFGTLTSTTNTYPLAATNANYYNPQLTLSTNLTVTGDISFPSFTGNSDQVIELYMTNASTISAASLTIGTAGGSTTSSANQGLYILLGTGRLTLSGDFTLNGTSNTGTNKYGPAATFIESGTVTANRVVFNNANATSRSAFFLDLSQTFGISGSGTLNVSAATPFVMSPTGTNVFVLGSTTSTANTTVNYAGTSAQNIMLNLPGLAGATTATDYDNLTFSGGSTKTPNISGGTIKVNGNFATAGTGTIVDLTTNNPAVAVTGTFTNTVGNTVKQGTGNASVTGTFSNAGTYTGSSGTLNVTDVFTNTNIFTQGTGALTAGSTFTNSGTFTGNGAKTITGAFNNSNVFTQGTGTLTVGGSLTSSGTFTGGGTITVTGSSTLNAGTFSSGTGTYTTAGIDNTTGTFNQGTGAVTMAGSIRQFSGAMNFSAGTVTIGTSIAITGGTMSAGTGTMNIGNALSIATGRFNGGASPAALNITGPFLNTTGTFSAGTGTTTFKQAYTNSGTFIFGAGTMIFNNGATAQALQDNSTTGTIFNNVTFTGTGAKTMSGTNPGQFYVDGGGLLTMAASSTLNAGGRLTLLSDADGSATVDRMGTSAVINGYLHVQRFFTGTAGGALNRGYRLMSSPVNQSNATAPASTFSMLYLNSHQYLNVTYPGVYTGGIGGSGSGFSGTSVGPTIYLYRENLAANNNSFTTGKYVGISAIAIASGTTTNTTTGPTGKVNTTHASDASSTKSDLQVPIGNGFLMYFVGPSSRNNGSSATAPVDATMTANGYLNQGTFTVHLWQNGTGVNTLSYAAPGTDNALKGFNMVGNPYASTINLASVLTAADNPGIDAAYLLGTRTGGANQNYVVYSATGGTSSPATPQYVVSGGGFIVHATSGSATLTFKETHKAPGVQLTGDALIMSGRDKGDLAGGKLTPVKLAANKDAIAALPPQTTTTQPLTGLYMKMEKDSIAFDYCGIYFGNNYNAKFGGDGDALYLTGPATTVNMASLSADGRRAAINNLPDYRTTSRVKLFINATTTGLYKLKLEGVRNIDSLYDIYLVDHYKKDSLNIRRYGVYNFNVNKTDTASFGERRFELSFQRKPLPQYLLANFNGAKVTEGVKLNWNTQNEGNYTGFTLEKQNTKGSLFDAVYERQGDGSSAYSYVDREPKPGINIYRLKQNDIDGKISYSEPITVFYDKLAGNQLINVFPNPTAEMINVSIPDNMQSPMYKFRVYNSSGNVVLQKTSSTRYWAQSVGQLQTGVYIVQIEKSDGTSLGKVKFVKQ